MPGWCCSLERQRSRYGSPPCDEGSSLSDRKIRWKLRLQLRFIIRFAVPGYLPCTAVLCVINEDWHSQLLQARNTSREDLGIVISYSGSTVEVIECMKAMRENHTPIIAITRCISSPVSELADYKLYTTANESTFRTGAMSSRISQLNIIDILYTAFANREYERCLEQLSRTHIRKPPLTPKASETPK